MYKIWNKNTQRQIQIKTWLIEYEQVDDNEGVAGTDWKHKTIAALEQNFLDFFFNYQGLCSDWKHDTIAALEQNFLDFFLLLSFNTKLETIAALKQNLKAWKLENWNKTWILENCAEEKRLIFVFYCCLELSGTVQIEF